MSSGQDDKQRAGAGESRNAEAAPTPFRNPRTRTAMRLAVPAVFLIFFLVLLFVFQGALLPFVLGLFVAYILAPPVRWLHNRIGMPRAVTVLALFATLLGGLGVFGYFVLPQLGSELAVLPSAATKYFKEFQKDLKAKYIPAINRELGKYLPETPPPLAELESPTAEPPKVYIYDPAIARVAPQGEGVSPGPVLPLTATPLAPLPAAPLAPEPALPASLPVPAPPATAAAVPPTARPGEPDDLPDGVADRDPAAADPAAAGLPADSVAGGPGAPPEDAAPVVAAAPGTAAPSVATVAPATAATAAPVPVAATPVPMLRASTETGLPPGVILAPPSLFRLHPTVGGGWIVSTDAAAFTVEDLGDGKFLVVPSMEEARGKVTRDPDYFMKTLDETLSRVPAKLGAYVGEGVSLVQTIVSSTISVFVSFILTFMVAGFLLVDVDRVLKFLQSLLPGRLHTDFDVVVERLDKGLSGVIRGQLLICLINGVFSGIGFWLLGLKFWLVLAIIAAFGSLIPIFGTVLSSIPAVALGLTQGFITGVLVLAWILGVHFIEANFLNPKIIGSQARIHPVLVILALVVGEAAAGLAGALLAVPTFSVLQTVFLYVRNKAAREPSNLVVAAAGQAALSLRIPPRTSPTSEDEPAVSDEGSEREDADARDERAREADAVDAPRL